MQLIRGHFNGSVVVLDEPAPVSEPIEVVVQFPGPREVHPPVRKFHWEESRARVDSLRGTVTEELFRQRREE